MNNIPKQRIILAHDPEASSNQNDSGEWSFDINLYYSDDFFKTSKLLLEYGNKFVLNKKFLN